MLCKPYLGKSPTIEEDVYLSENVTLIGDVRLRKSANIWYGTVLRGDINYIEIGENTNVQDNCIFHVADDHPVVLGKGITVGHGAIVHGCTVEDDCFIGMGAILLDGAKVGQGSLIAAGALVTEGMVVPPRSLVMGVPARVKGSIDDERLEKMKQMAIKYKKVAKNQSGTCL